MQATVDINMIASWWEARPEANVILVTGRVFDVLDVPTSAGVSALARMEAAGAATGPVAVLGDDRMLFFVMTRGSPADEDEWWSCGLDCEPESDTPGLRWHCRDSFVLAPPSAYARGRPRAGSARRRNTRCPTRCGCLSTWSTRGGASDGGTEMTSPRSSSPAPSGSPRAG